MAQEVLLFLLGERAEAPPGIGTYEGRIDLRGFALPSSKVVGSLSVGGIKAEKMDGIHEFHTTRWHAIDLSHARLSTVRFFGAVISDCRFDSAICLDWRLWDTTVVESSFAGSNLRDAALLTWQNGRTNTWRDVNFDGADLRGAHGLGGVLERCSFGETRLKGFNFLQVAIRHCRFTGLLQDILFDGREIPGRRPQPEVMTDVDFSKAVFQEVEFRGCHFDGVELPKGVYVIPRFPPVARRVLELLEHDESLEARMLRAEMNGQLKRPGADTSVTVFNRADYLTSGGEPLADLVESLLLEALKDTSRRAT